MLLSILLKSKYHSGLGSSWQGDLLPTGRSAPEMALSPGVVGPEAEAGRSLQAALDSVGGPIYHQAA